MSCLVAFVNTNDSQRFFDSVLCYFIYIIWVDVYKLRYYCFYPGWPVFIYYSLSTFIFDLLLVLLSPLKCYLVLCRICYFISYFALLYLLSFLLLVIPRDILNQKCRVKTNSYNVIYLDIHENTFYCVCLKSKTLPNVSPSFFQHFSE